LVEKTNSVPGENRPYGEIELLYGGLFNKDKKGQKNVTCKNWHCGKNYVIERDAVERFYYISLNIFLVNNKNEGGNNPCQEKMHIAKVDIVERFYFSYWFKVISHPYKLIAKKKVRIYI